MKFLPPLRTTLPLLLAIISTLVSIEAQNPTNPDMPTPATPTFDEVWKKYPDKVDFQNADFSDHFSMKWLRRDMRLADVVAHVKIVEQKLADRTESADCERNRGSGYCSYRLTADVRQIYKGKVPGAKLEFFASADADYPKGALLGERVVFLEWGEPNSGKSAVLGTIENSTRWIDHNVLAKMTIVTDSTAKISEDDEREPYSLLAIKKSFDESDAVAYVDAVKFRPDPDSLLAKGAIVTARVKEVFKGSLNVGETIEYREDFVHRHFRNDDLGQQVVYLNNYTPMVLDMMELDKASGKMVRKKGEVKEKGVLYKSLEYTEGFIKHGILEKLRSISSTN